MSKVLIDASGMKNLAGREPALTHVVEADGEVYTVDSQYVLGGWYETMVFPITDHSDSVYEEHYGTHEEMQKHHMMIIENLERFIGGESK